MIGTLKNVELQKIYDTAFEDDNFLVVKLVREIWLLQDMCDDAWNEARRYQHLLREERKDASKHGGSAGGGTAQISRQPVKGQ